MGARRRFDVEDGRGLFCEVSGVLAALSFPCRNGLAGVRDGVFVVENGDSAYDIFVAAVVAVALLSLLLRLAVFFFFRTVAGGLRSIILIAALVVRC